MPPDACAGTVLSCANKRIGEAMNKRGNQYIGQNAKVLFQAGRYIPCWHLAYCGELEWAVRYLALQYT